MVICGMIKIFLSPTGGLLNLILGTQIDFLTHSEFFRTIYIASGIWQDAGWGCIIYLATLANVDPGLYEAAKMDGASVFQRILHIDIPELMPMVVLNLIMAAGGIMNVGFEKVWLLQTDLNKATSDVIAVYVYQQGIEQAKYSYSTDFYPVDCVFTQSELDDLDLYKPDFENHVKEQEALWFRDGGPSDAEWEAYKQDLIDTYGMNQILEVYKNAYDRYAAAE